MKDWIHFSLGRCPIVAEPFQHGGSFSWHDPMKRLSRGIHMNGWTMRASDRRGDPHPLGGTPCDGNPGNRFTPRKAQVLIDPWWFHVGFSYSFQLLGEYHYAAYGQLSMQAKTHLSFNLRPWASSSCFVGNINPPDWCCWVCDSCHELDMQWYINKLINKYK